LLLVIRVLAYCFLVFGFLTLDLVVQVDYLPLELDSLPLGTFDLDILGLVCNFVLLHESFICLYLVSAFLVSFKGDFVL
jgi:hypothetical protein